MDTTTHFKRRKTANEHGCGGDFFSIKTRHVSNILFATQHNPHDNHRNKLIMIFFSRFCQLLPTWRAYDEEREFILRPQDRRWKGLVELTNGRCFASRISSYTQLFFHFNYRWFVAQTVKDQNRASRVHFIKPSWVLQSIEEIRFVRYDFFFSFSVFILIWSEILIMLVLWEQIPASAKHEKVKIENGNKNSIWFPLGTTPRSW